MATRHDSALFRAALQRAVTAVAGDCKMGWIKHVELAEHATTHLNGGVEQVNTERFVSNTALIRETSATVIRTRLRLPMGGELTLTVTLSQTWLTQKCQPHWQFAAEPSVKFKMKGPGEVQEAEIFQRCGANANFPTRQHNLDLFVKAWDESPSAFGDEWYRFVTSLTVAGVEAVRFPCTLAG